MSNLDDVMQRLAVVISERRNASPEESYVAKLLGRGKKKIAQKVGEEGVEVALALMQEKKESIVSESADLLFHLLIAWEHADISFDELAEELIKREGKSGIAEKASRKEA